MKTTKIKLRITQKHIKQGEKNRDRKLMAYCSCPAVLALNDLGFPNARVYAGWFHLGSAPGRLTVPHTKRLGLWIRAFDRRKPVRPATFTLTIPVEALPARA